MLSWRVSLSDPGMAILQPLLPLKVPRVLVSLLGTLLPTFSVKRRDRQRNGTFFAKVDAVSRPRGGPVCLRTAVGAESLRQPVDGVPHAPEVRCLGAPRPTCCSELHVTPRTWA